MNWLDRVLAVPTIGVRFRPWFKTASDYVRALDSFFEALEPNGTADVKAAVAEIEFESKSGLRGKVTSQDLIVSFAYKAEMKERPGDVPHLHYPMPIDRFSAVLDTVEQSFGEAARALLGAQRRSVERIGIVANARLDRHALPPGAERLLGYLARPWELGLEECTAQLSAVLQRADGLLERCHHRIEFSDAPASGEPTGILALTLDWQQVYGPTRQMSAEEVVRSTAACRAAALAYFEKFGRGELAYAC